MGKYTANDLDPGAYKPGSLREPTHPMSNPVSVGDDLVGEDDFYDDESEQCPHCNGDGEVPCHCGGDLCCCENNGDAPCPVCFGDRSVSKARYDRYFENQRRNHALLAALNPKAPS